jgi:hypothetical protein
MCISFFMSIIDMISSLWFFMRSGGGWNHLYQNRPRTRFWKEKYKIKNRYVDQWMIKSH